MPQQTIAAYTEQRNDLLAQIGALRERHKIAQKRLDALKSVQLTASGPESAALKVDIATTADVLREIENDLDDVNEKMQQVQRDFVAEIDAKFRNGTGSKASTAQHNEAVSATLMAELLSSSIDVGHQLAQLNERLDNVCLRQEDQGRRLDIADAERRQHMQMLTVLYSRTALDTLVGMFISATVLLAAFYLWAIKEVRDGVLLPRSITITFTILAVLVSVYLFYNIISQHWRDPR